MISGFLKTKDYVHFDIVSPSGSLQHSFIGAYSAGKALPGDWILWNEESKSCSIQKRTRHWPLVGILELASKTKYGMTSRGSPMYLFTPFQKGYPSFVVGSSERDTSKHKLAVIEFESWDTTSLPRGLLRSILGDCDDYSVLRKALLLNYNPFPNSKKLESCDLETQTIRVPCPEITFNIDPPGCKDIDDVLSIVINENTVELWITITDVSEKVAPNSVLDIAASLQAFTAYDKGAAVKPMLPSGISEDECSLIPGKERLGVSLVLTLDFLNPANILSSYWICSTVKNKKQYTYENFKTEARTDGIPVDILEKTASGILGYETQDPHEWIEAFMLKYNMEVAKLLRKEGRGVLRNHKESKRELLEKYQKIVGTDLTFLAKQSAKYCHTQEQDVKHYGLEAEVYCHATSPLRRYADLLNQRVLKDILQGTHTHVDPEFLWLNNRQKEMKQYERDLFFLDQILLNKTGKINAIVLEKKEAKIIFWSLDWKRTVSWKPLNIPDSLEEGQTVSLSYFINPAGRSWKEKIVFHLEK